MIDSVQKEKRYGRMYEQLKELLKVTDNRFSRMATIAAVLHHKMDTFFWTGFYILTDGELLVGPYQGFVACQKLEKGKGVCWAAVERGQTVIVPDVSKFEGHIACDSRSKSEIVVPCMDQRGEVFAVLDVDSDKIDSFDEIDSRGLETITKLITQ